MPPVLTASSRNYDYDYDTVQPYFFLDGEEEVEDFYLPGPGEDMWKKFELLPTPPVSPSRRVSPSDGQHLEEASQHLEDHDHRDPSAALLLLQSFVIQDCMWSSSFAAVTELEKVVSERLASLRARRDSSSTSSPDGGQQPGGSQVNLYLQDFHHTDCIDPSVVLPFTAVKKETELCPDTPALSSSDSESEEEEEEIDVVTVNRRKASRQSDAGSRATSPSLSSSPSSSSSSSSLVLKRSHVNIHQHDYAAQQPAGKRSKPESSSPALRKSGGGVVGGGRRRSNPRPDGEDDRDKRRTHNVLERQRRNELKRSFSALRDQIPTVADNHRAAKVWILKEATQFVHEVREDERRLLTRKEELRKRSEELRHRLEQLRTLR
ncbi:transcriptional regulator Myc-B-like isoform X2 [Anarrhichthys ocellatus]|uniref:transcriptional regulator Myc-B-like isoform X2 n=1 Tax=Anarrhichthys ocellatus TaxID=433405 RepID=UPI0012EDE5DA|nr:transcriptional regulator Myc-B-like isoform X2 [Anarrhichthys ocellatus]